jgi:hypothetical protein
MLVYLVWLYCTLDCALGNALPYGVAFALHACRVGVTYYLWLFKTYSRSLCAVPFRAVPIVASTSSPSLLYGFVNARSCVPTAYAMFNYV